ncbi:MAG: energy-coupling factor transporter transmembrane protein EcfT [Candidatus Marsarchaeota archaeon]|nr:energy-coupling factor transporter transmembrane protein EcfT [Candidatus Marsarchaeota archaeon]
MSYLRSLGYRRGDTPLHKLDPRTKLVIGVCLAIIFTFLVEGVVTYAAVAAVFFAVATYVGLRGAVIRLMRSSLLFAVLLFAINYYFLRSLDESLYIVERFLIFIELFSILAQTTSPDDVSAALKRIGAPDTFALAFNMALRFLPTMAAEIDSITASQRSRGLELDKGGFFKRVRNYLPIMVPLLINAIMRIDQVAEALESRCFGASKEPTAYHSISMKYFDWLVAMSTLSLTLALSIAALLHHSPLTLP